MSTKARVSTIIIIDPTVGNTKNLSAQIAIKLLLKRRTWTSTWNSIVMTSRRSAKHVEKDSTGGVASGYTFG